MLPLMRAIFAQAKLHAFYLMALWFWGGILVVWQWWIAFDVAACVLLTLIALAMQVHRTPPQSGDQQKATEPAGTALL